MLARIDQIAHELGVSKSTVYQWVAQRRIPHHKIGRVVRFDTDEIRTWVDQQKVKTTYSEIKIID